MNMYDMLAQAQGGRAFANLGNQFGLSEEETANAVRHLLPAFSTGLKRNTANPEGIGSLLDALGGGRHERYYDDGDVFGHDETRDEGDNILGHVLGSKDVSRAAAERASEQTGIGSDLLKKMLPYIATMVMGALFKNSQNPLGSILGQVLGGGAPQSQPQVQPHAGDNPFGDLAKIILGGGQVPQRTPGPTNGTDIFGQMLDADGDGSSMDDIFDMVLGGQRR